MQRQRQLERCGWEFFRVRESAFYSNRIEAIDGLWGMLEERDIFPGSLRAGVSPEVSEVAMREDDYDEYDCDAIEDDEDFEDDEDSSSDDSVEDLTSSGRRAEQVSTTEIQDAILQVLSKCPNQSCTLHSLTSRVLKEVGVLTRGNPRVEFERRVMRSVDALERRERIEKYKAKNRRIRLVHETV